MIIEIDEYRFCADAFVQSESRIIDREAFLAFAGENLFAIAHDDDDDPIQATWWNRYRQRPWAGRRGRRAGVRLSDGGEDQLPIDQPPELFPDHMTRALWGQHVQEVA